MILVDDNTKAIVDKIVDTAKAGIIEVYAKVQQATPELWKLVVRQMWINGIEYFIGSLFALGFLVYGIWAIRYALRDKCDDLEELFAITGVIAVILGGLLFPVFLVDGLDLALNPQYWALHDILEMVRGGSK